MSAATSEANAESSSRDGRSRGPRRGAPRLAFGRLLLALAGLAGVVCLVASAFATVIRVEVAGSTDVPGFDTLASGWDRHGPALVLLALVGLALLGLALRGARAAAVALAVVGIACIVLVLTGDAGDLHDTGALSEAYEQATAGAGAGFYLETAGGVLLLLAGGALALLPPAERRR